jgi:hypothetical protein
MAATIRRGGVDDQVHAAVAIGHGPQRLQNRRLISHVDLQASAPAPLSFSSVSAERAPPATDQPSANRRCAIANPKLRAPMISAVGTR